MTTFHYSLLDGTQGELNDIVLTWTVALIINELEQLHGMSVSLVCHDRRGKHTVYGRTGRHRMTVPVANIIRSSESITALNEPSRPPLLLQRVPDLVSEPTWCCFRAQRECIIPCEIQENYVLFIIVGLLHQECIAQIESGKAGANLAWALRGRLEGIILGAPEWCFVGLGGLPFRWEDTSISRVCRWRALLSQVLNWAIAAMQRQVVHPHPTHKLAWQQCSSVPPVTILDTELFLEGLTLLRTEILGKVKPTKLHGSPRKPIWPPRLRWGQ